MLLDKIISGAFDPSFIKVVRGGEDEARHLTPLTLELGRKSPCIIESDINYDILDEATSFVNSRPKPLSLYIFSRDPIVQDRIINETSSGGVCINDAMVHFASDVLQFGGVG